MADTNLPPLQNQLPILPQNKHQPMAGTQNATSGNTPNVGLIPTPLSPSGGAMPPPSPFPSYMGHGYSNQGPQTQGFNPSSPVFGSSQPMVGMNPPFSAGFNPATT